MLHTQDHNPKVAAADTSQKLKEMDMLGTQVQNGVLCSTNAEFHDNLGKNKITNQQ